MIKKDDRNSFIEAKRKRGLDNNLHMWLSKGLISTGELKPAVFGETFGKIIYEISPSGSTVGNFEAKVECPSDSSFEQFIRGIKNDYLSVMEFDDRLKSFGSNLSVPASLVYYRLKNIGFKNNCNLPNLKNHLADKKISMPKIILNMINGGKHTGGSTSMCEFMIIPQGCSVKENISIAEKIWKVLAINLKTRGQNVLVSGREGGYVTEGFSDIDVIRSIDEAIDQACVECSIGIDVAANNFSTRINGEWEYSIMDTVYSTEEFIKYYEWLVELFPKISYLEDPFNEADLLGWKILRKALSNKNILVVADDLTVSDAVRIREFKDCFNALILKINQAGTISKFYDALSVASELHCVTIMSQRSGENDNATIVDVGVDAGVDMMKLGAPARERIIKYNHLLFLEESFNNDFHQAKV